MISLALSIVGWPEARFGVYLDIFILIALGLSMRLEWTP